VPSKKIYCLSGLGADERIFSNLSIQGVQLVHLSWITPDKNDSLPDYARKMAQLINDPEPVIIGMSFGGMLATEIAKSEKVQKAIIISSAKAKDELPDLNIFLKMLIEYRLIPKFLYAIPNPVVNKLFGAATHEEKKLLNSIIGDTDGAFVKWAFRAMLHWQNMETPSPVVHIHGTKDDILPSRLSKPDYWVKDGTHLMIYNRAEEIAEIIRRELSL
jgi:pimeloyl-ACP methyl ester carboxylesterase